MNFCAASVDESGNIDMDMLHEETLNSQNSEKTFVCYI